MPLAIVSRNNVAFSLIARAKINERPSGRQCRGVTIMRANSPDFFRLGFFTGLFLVHYTSRSTRMRCECVCVCVCLCVCVCWEQTRRARRTGFIEKQSGNSGEYVAQNEKSISCTDALFTVSRDKFFSVSLRRISA